MSHLSEGAIREIQDDPGSASERDRDHLESCAACRILSSQVKADGEVAHKLLSEDAGELDPEVALTRLLEAVSSGAPVAAGLVWESEQKPVEEPKVKKPREKVGFLTYVGRTFVGMGLLILLFVAYQLVGTNIVTNQEQKTLQTQWVSSVVEDTPNLGEGIALIKIPKIGVDRVVVQGTEVEDLKKGPGHIVQTDMPGELGNMVISGHRTTYGAPFNRLDELNVGDEIFVYDKTRPYRYLVTEKKVVAPTAVSVLDLPTDPTEARLTLTTCNPKFSARERLIIVARLDGTPKGPSSRGGGGFTVVPGEP